MRYYTRVWQFFKYQLRVDKIVTLVKDIYTLNILAKHTGMIKMEDMMGGDDIYE